MAALTRLGPAGTPIAALTAELAELTATLAVTEAPDVFAADATLVSPAFDVVLDDVLLSRLELDGSVCGLLTDTAILATAFGLERRRASLVVPRESFVLHYQKSDLLDVQALFRAHEGQKRSFLFDDLDDNLATEVELLKVTVLGVTVCQLRQSYVSRSVYDDSIVRTVYQPVYRVKDATLAVTVDDVAVTQGVDFEEVDGILTFTSEISGTIKASFGFYKIVRFAEDALESVWVEQEIREIRALKLITVLQPSSFPFGAA